MTDTQATVFPSAELNQCPYDFYERGREASPVEQVAGSQEFRLYRHRDIAFVLQHEDLFSAYIPTAYTSAGLDYGGAVHIGADDGERHKANRNLMSRPFTPGRLKSYEPMILAHVETLIDGFIDTGKVELAWDFANPLPALVISSLMALPTNGPDFAFLQAWNAAFVRTQPTEEFVRMQSYMLETLRARHANPGKDILSELIERQVARDGEFDEALCTTLGVEMIAGGVITTGQLITNAMILLLRHPDQMGAVRADHRKIKDMLEEALRVETPVQWRLRYAREDVEIGGVSIPAGSLLWLLLGSGNQDDFTFDCPADFRLGRRNIKRHFGFGLGLHFCLGAPLARLEARIAFERLFTRLGDIRLDEGNDFHNVDSPVFRMPRQLRLEFDVA
jgi:cytochrome P450